MSDHILTNFSDGVFEIILNRPDKRNAIRVQMLQAIAAAVIEAERIDDARVIVLKGEGDNFSAGIDLMAMGGMPELLGDDWRKMGYEVTRMWQTTISRIQESTLPAIALLKSYTLGAGLELALGCDMRIAADNTTISLEEARLGMIPDAGGTTRLTQLVGVARAKELIFTGKRIDADTALQWGLVNDVVPLDDLEAKGHAMAEEIIKCAPMAISAAKRTINAIVGSEDGLKHEMIEQYRLFHSEDIMEGMQAAMQRRPANWVGR